LGRDRRHVNQNIPLRSRKEAWTVFAAVDATKEAIEAASVEFRTDVRKVIAVRRWAVT
jgi:hypothetical protein